jgi:phospholipase C
MLRIHVLETRPLVAQDGQRLLRKIPRSAARSGKEKFLHTFLTTHCRRGLSTAALFCCLPLILALVGCGANSSVTGSLPPTVTIAATPTSIMTGNSVSLTVAATNASGITVTGSDGSSFSLPATGGTKTLTPATTTTYTATATGLGGSATAATMVTVGTIPAPTVTINASPTSINTGGSSVLTVTAANATQVTIAGSDGSSYSLSATGGTKTVSPTATTTYTATATGTGTATATTTVTVVAAAVPPTVSINASPASIATGGSSVLTVAATNATQVTLTGTDGSSYSLSAAGGTKTVSPTSTTTYTATATGTGTATATTTVTVTAAATPTVTITANPASITAGSSSTLTVTATNATQVTVTGTDGSSHTLSSTGGTVSVTPSTTTTYMATATGTSSNATASTKVTVTAVASPTVAISANPTSVTVGGSSTLTVTATNASQVTVTGTDGSTYTLASTGGAVTVTPSATTTYTATATEASSNATASTKVTVTPAPAPTATIAANPTSIMSGNSSTLTVTATNATQVSISGTDGTNYTLSTTGGTQAVSPTATTTYTATATGAGGNTTATATVTVTPAGSLQSVDHVIFMLQENHTFDNYLGMLNPYRESNSTNGVAWNIGADGKTYNVDGIDDKLTTSNSSDEGTSYPLFKFTSTCVDDMTSSWLESYGDVSRYDFSTTRPINMDGFVHTAENYAKNCNAAGDSGCAGTFTDFTGQRAMGYYDQGFLNYYYYMASQFALSDRWFSPMSSKSIPNRIATFTGGTTQGLVFDPGGDDDLPQLDIPTIFRELTNANVSWKIYYTVTQGSCLSEDDCAGGASAYPATDFSYLQDSYEYLYENPTRAACVAPTQASSAVGDTTNSFCIDTSHIAPLPQYYTDLTNGTLPSFSFIEAGYGNNDEHPGSGQSILAGQQEVANVVNSLMTSSEWQNSVFFLAYDEGGGPYDHVPPVSGHSNDNTDTTGPEALPGLPDISAITVNADSYNPCVPPGGTATTNCDLKSGDPGAVATDAPAVQGFAAQLGFRVPNMVISPFTRKHYVSHIPMDHTAILKFVENRFISASAHLTARDAAQPNLLDFFDFTNVPWAIPPTPPTPVTSTSSCTPATFSATPSLGKHQ